MTVNRPYAAFGALAALLALSMLAVSSSSRSTTVQPASTSASRKSAPKRSSITAAVRAMSADICADGDDTTSDACNDDCYPLGSFACERTIASCDLSMLSSGCCSRSKPLGSARVQAAENTLRAQPVADMPCDGRSYYDPMYDQIVYGTALEEQSPRRERVEQTVGDAPIVDDDWLTIFRDLITTPNGVYIHPRTGSGECSGCSRWSAWINAAAIAVQRRDTIRTGLNSNSLNGLWVRVRSWTTRWTAWPLAFYRSINRLSARDESHVSWMENADPIGRSVRIISVTYSPAATSSESISVQSGGWLRHSAAASLYRLGLLLQAAGRDLDQAGSTEGLTESIEPAFGR